MRKLFAAALVAACIIALSSGFSNCRGDDSKVELLQVLREWEQATAGLPKPLPDAAFPDLFESHTAHELDVAARLYGAVTARELIEEFNWSLESTTQTTIVVKGFPRDKVAQLFYSAFEVTLDRQSKRPSEIQFLDRDGTPREQAVRFRVVAARNPGATSGSVRTVAGNTGETGAAEAAPPQAELPLILLRWVAATREIRAAELRFRRYVYDSIHAEEIRGEGRFIFEAPGRGLYELRPVELSDGVTSQRTTADGEPFEMAPDEWVSCYWTGTHLVWIDERERSYETMPLPEANTGDIRPVGSWDRVWAGWAGPQRALPGVIDAHTDSFIDRFDWTLLLRNERQIILQGRPKTDDDRFHLSLLQVVLDPNTYLTTATRMIDASGNRETVHVFEPVRISREPKAESDDWEPDLTQYRERTAPPPAPPAVIEE